MSSVKINLAGDLDIDAQVIITGRGCAIGQSGSGKSFLAGVLTEELCRLGLPFCVIDTEGEYSSLKSISRNLIIAGGDHADISIDVDLTKLFEASIVNDIPVVMDLSDVSDRDQKVQEALGALYAVENRMRKPYLVVIEEADKFAPQISGKKKTNVIEEISVRGRKRGIGLFITTQRPANISKNVLAQCSYGFIGRLTIENDLNALRILFNDNERLARIARLEIGMFMPFGLHRLEPFKVKPRMAPHGGATPSVESYRPANARLASVIKELKGPAQPTLQPTGKGPAGTMVIRSLKPSITEADARAMALSLARRKFLLFGDPIESVSSVELQYVPLSRFTLRFPTRRRNEYMEYGCLISSKGELVRIGSNVSVLRTSEEYKAAKSNFRAYLRLEPMELEELSVEKRLALQPNLKSAKARIGRLFPDAQVADLEVVYLPVYRITLRHGNRVRVFGLDGVYGRQLSL